MEGEEGEVALGEDAGPDLAVGGTEDAVCRRRKQLAASGPYGTSALSRGSVQVSVLASKMSKPQRQKPQ